MNSDLAVSDFYSHLSSDELSVINKLIRFIQVQMSAIMVVLLCINNTTVWLKNVNGKILTHLINN